MTIQSVQAHAHMPIKAAAKLAAAAAAPASGVAEVSTTTGTPPSEAKAPKHASKPLLEPGLAIAASQAAEHPEKSEHGKIAAAARAAIAADPTLADLPFGKVVSTLARGLSLETLAAAPPPAVEAEEETLAEVSDEVEEAAAPPPPAEIDPALASVDADAEVAAELAAVTLLPDPTELFEDA